MEDPEYDGVVFDESSASRIAEVTRFVETHQSQIVQSGIVRTQHLPITSYGVIGCLTQNLEPGQSAPFAVLSRINAASFMLEMSGLIVTGSGGFKLKIQTKKPDVITTQTIPWNVTPNQLKEKIVVAASQYLPNLIVTGLYGDDEYSSVLFITCDDFVWIKWQETLSNSPDYVASLNIVQNNLYFDQKSFAVVYDVLGLHRTLKAGSVITCLPMYGVGYTLVGIRHREFEIITEDNTVQSNNEFH